MIEMALTADHLIVIGRGRLIADTDVAGFISAHSLGRIVVRTPERARLTELTQHPRILAESANRRRTRRKKPGEIFQQTGRQPPRQQHEHHPRRHPHDRDDHGQPHPFHTRNLSTVSAR